LLSSDSPLMLPIFAKMSPMRSSRSQVASQT
jgi:hypothetical protein